MKFVLACVLLGLVVSETFAYQNRQPQPFLTDQHWKSITDLYGGQREPTSWEVVKDSERINVLRKLSLTAFQRRLGVFENYERLQFGPTFRRSLQGKFTFPKFYFTSLEFTFFVFSASLEAHDQKYFLQF